MSEAVEFGEKSAADRYREEHADHICPVDDDARTKTVHFVSDTPEWLFDQARAEADEGRAARGDATGQSSLTDAERNRIDFSADRASVPWARSIKALAQTHGVSDWTAHVDSTLTVDEHRGVMRDAERGGGGARDDSHEDRATRRERRAAAREQGERCDHARGHCRNGDSEACEFLTKACGLDDDEVDNLMSGAGTDPEITGQAAGTLRDAWDGYQGAVSKLSDTLGDVLEPEWEHAQQAARAINTVREEHGQDPIHFERLEKVQASFLDFARHTWLLTATSVTRITPIIATPSPTGTARTSEQRSSTAPPRRQSGSVTTRQTQPTHDRSDMPR